MKKLVVFLAVLLFMVNLSVYSIKAEEIPQNEPQNEIQEEIEAPITEDDVLALIKDKLGALSENQIVLDILAWLRDAGVLSGLAIVLTKYRKYKGKTVGEIVETVSDKIKDEVDKTLKDNTDKIKDLCGKVEELEKLVNTFTKALVLMQDDSTKGRLALLEYLSVNTNDTSVEEVKETVEEDLKKIDTIKESLKDEYNDIF